MRYVFGVLAIIYLLISIVFFEGSERVFHNGGEISQRYKKVYESASALGKLRIDVYLILKCIFWPIRLYISLRDNQR